MDHMHEGEQLKKLIKGSGIEINKASELLDMSRQNLNHHLRKEVLDLNFSKLVKERLNLSVENDVFHDSSKNLIPYYPDINASAGLSFLTDNSSMRVEMINIPNVDAQAFINVFGDSMYPKYCSGEIIGIKEIEKDYVMFGQAYVIQMKNGEAYLKYIKAGKDNNHWFLANENSHYEPKEFHLSKIDKVFIIKAVITKTTL